MQTNTQTPLTPGKVKSVSFVIPCLNEEMTLGTVLEKINKVRKEQLKSIKTEIVVSDNGSDDNSIAIAKKNGARVINCDTRGYGAALQCGIKNAKHEVVIFADADNTYDFFEAPLLIEELEKGYDMVMGSRLDGNIHKGAMPFLHHYLGTPVLNFFINLFYARKGFRVRDCNSGFRCFRKEKFMEWTVESTGMEFASEMIIKALKSGAPMSYVPISLYPDVRDRVPHLKTWRDGMRHLLQILLNSQGAFNVSGLFLFSLSWAALLVGLFNGPVNLGFVSIFGLHSMLFALLGAFLGQSIWGIGLYLAAKQNPDIRAYQKILGLDEGSLFWLSLFLMLFSLAFFIIILIHWSMANFQFLDYQRQTLVFTAFGSAGILFVSQCITAHMLKRV